MNNTTKKDKLRLVDYYILIRPIGPITYREIIWGGQDSIIECYLRGGFWFWWG